MLIEYERERTLTNKIRSEKVEVKTDSTEIKGPQEINMSNYTLIKWTS